VFPKAANRSKTHVIPSNNDRSYLPQEPPEHTSEHVKPQNFLGACPQIPFQQSVFRGPIFPVNQ